MTSSFPAGRALAVTVPLIILIAAVSLGGLFLPQTYARESANWTAQALAQDIFDLVVVVPVLLVSAFLVRRGSRLALLVWLGTMLYNAYTFVIYSFSVHFNPLFPVYCWTLGLTAYGAVAVGASVELDAVKGWFDDGKPILAPPVFLSLLALLFFGLWIKEILDAIAGNTLPRSLQETGLPANPVYVLDLAFCLPGFVITSYLLWKKRPLGYLLMPSLLVFAILMDLAIGALAVAYKARGLSSDLTLTVIMGVLALVTVLPLVSFLHHGTAPPKPAGIKTPAGL